MRTKQYVQDRDFNHTLLFFPGVEGDRRIPQGIPQGWVPGARVFSAGLAEKNPLTAEFKDHLRKYVPTLRSYGLTAAADYYHDWVQDRLTGAPLLDISALLGG